MKLVLLPTLLLVLSFTSCETLKNFPVSSSLPVTENEAGQGVRQALSQGVTSAIFNLNKQDGFFGNQAYKLFLPEDAQKVASTLRNLGLGAQVDKAILQINRAAEDAVGYAKPVFADAIKDMSISDALNIVRGGNNSATTYFREKTRTKLVSAFAPSVKHSLDKVQATKYYSDLVNTYNRIPTTFKKLNPDLTGYVVEKATDALFDQIAKEEANIRANPVARTTEILKRVFGMR
ncbi:MAG: DUF4197 domain-containing protein [Chitinophagaceae bacterium]|nr:DUF4197 domain-containing protein [Chitinophagaceae bacterium]